MKKACTVILITLFVLILFFGAGFPAAAQEETEEPFNPVTEPVTDEPFNPVTEPVTELPTIRPPTTTTLIVGGGKGYIDTYCNVDGASVSFDGRYQCTISQGVCTVGVSPTGYIRTVSVAKAGYTAWSTTLLRMPADQEHVVVYATINPIPTQTTIPPAQGGAIYTQSSPAGAAIYMNGNFEGYSPMTIRDVAPGTYSLKASLAGYSPDSDLVTVYAGKTATYYPVLQPSPPAPRSTGTVIVTSSPGAALVFVDGNYQGKTSMTVTLYPGTHSIRLSLPGYSDYVSSVYVSAGSNQRLDAALGAAVQGSVAVSSVPGATVWMDSNSQGPVPASGTLTIAPVTGGNHIFKVTAGGYNDWISTVYVQPTMVTPVNAVLIPSGGVVTPVPTPATGGFNIVSTPDGAELYIDNLFRGYTPSMPGGISAGQHKILLKHAGYIDYGTTATVQAGQTTPLAISMQPAPTPTPESPLSPVLLIGEIMIIAGICVSVRRRSK